MKNETEHSPDFDVRIYPVKAGGNLKATASVTIDGVFAVRNVKVMEGSKGLFVSMPAFKAKSGEYKGLCFPVTKEAREAFNGAVLAAYEQSPEQVQENGMPMSQSM